MSPSSPSLISNLSSHINLPPPDLLCSSTALTSTQTTAPPPGYSQSLLTVCSTVTGPTSTLRAATGRVVVVFLLLEILDCMVWGQSIPPASLPMLSPHTLSSGLHGLLSDLPAMGTWHMLFPLPRTSSPTPLAPLPKSHHPQPWDVSSTIQYELLQVLISPGAIV